MFRPFSGYVFAIIFYVLINSLYSSIATAAQYQYLAHVVYVQDGDTIIVVDVHNVKHKIQLYGIDAPELTQRRGEESRNNLVDLLPKNRYIVVEVEGRDRYQRELATIYVGCENINCMQIADGYAWHYYKFDKKYNYEYNLSEKKARLMQKGLWQDSNPQAPWEYRRIKKFQN